VLINVFKKSCVFTVYIADSLICLVSYLTLYYYTNIYKQGIWSLVNYMLYVMQLLHSSLQSISYKPDCYCDNNKQA